MLIVGENRSSTLVTCLKARHIFHLGENAAKGIIARQIDTIRGHGIVSARKFL